jgi:hypothetical protein
MGSGGGNAEATGQPRNCAVTDVIRFCNVAHRLAGIAATGRRRRPVTCELGFRLTESRQGPLGCARAGRGVLGVVGNRRGGRPQRSAIIVRFGPATTAPSIRNTLLRRRVKRPEQKNFLLDEGLAPRVINKERPAPRRARARDMTTVDRTSAHLVAQTSSVRGAYVRELRAASDKGSYSGQAALSLASRRYLAIRDSRVRDRPHHAPAGQGIARVFSKIRG